MNTALSNKAMFQFKSDLISLVILLISLLIIFKIVLYKEDTLFLFIAILKYFYSVIIPGLFVSLYLHRKLNFISRLILGSVFMIAIVSILSYYFGLLGLHVKYHPYILPPLVIVLGIFVSIRNRKS